MTFNFYKRPGKIVLLDDDPHFLEVMGMLLNDSWAIELFDQPSNLLLQFDSVYQMLEHELAYHKSIIQKTNIGESTISAMLEYWKQDQGQRFNTPTVLILDYAMPAITGTQLLEKISYWPGLQVLLTGQADECTAISAFNRGLIHQYIPKQSPDLINKLTGTINNYGDRFSNCIGKLWATGLTRHQTFILESSAFTRWLTAHLEATDYTEYVVIGAPFGVLGLNSQGVPGWVQINDKDSSVNVQELLQSIDLSKLAPDDLSAIVGGNFSIDIELQTALKREGPYRIAPNIVYEEQPNLSITHFSLDPLFPSGSYGSWINFLQNYSNRSIS